MQIRPSIVFQDRGTLSGSPSSANSAARQTIDLLHTSSNKEQPEKISFIIFSSGKGERLVYQAYNGSWAAVLDEEISCQRDAVNQVKVLKISCQVKCGEA